MIQRRFRPFVYFIRQVSGDGPVKIGCSQSPAERLVTLMCWSPYSLEVVASMPGDETLERRFHAKFREQHAHNEWFSPSAELDQVIAAIADGSFDIDTLPPPKGIHSRRGQGWPPFTRARFDAVRRIGQLIGAGVDVPARLHGHSWYQIAAEDHPALVRDMQAFIAQFPEDFGVPAKAPRKRAA